MKKVTKTKTVKDKRAEPVKGFPPLVSFHEPLNVLRFKSRDELIAYMSQWEVVPPKS